MSPKIIKFLIKLGANPHAEDENGDDICDKVYSKSEYKGIKQLYDGTCFKNQKLRTTPEETIDIYNLKKENKLRILSGKPPLEMDHHHVHNHEHTH